MVNADNPIEDNIALLHQLLVLSLKLLAINTDLTLGFGETVGSCKILILIVKDVVDLPELLIVATACGIIRHENSLCRKLQPGT